MSVDEIEKAITKLSSKERARLLKLLEEMDAAEWDRKFEEDVKAGKLDKLADEAIAEHKKGLTREL
jgi:SOS-response transcriptional repressor LexA